MKGPRGPEGETPEVVVNCGSCGLAVGAGEVAEAAERFFKERGLEGRVKRAGCMGLCFAEPLMVVGGAGLPSVVYRNVRPEDVSRILESHLLEGLPSREFALGTLGEGIEGIPRVEDFPFWTLQERRVLFRCGFSDPTDIEDYIASGGYSGLERALKVGPEGVVEEVKRSGLRGRGGAGFPTGLKWELTRKREAEERFVICNAAEGDVGAFMDRVLLEGDPHLILEGLIIAGFAVGARKGFVYVRSEYELAAQRMRRAVEQARERGFLGERVLGTSFSFEVEVFQAVGMFVCGEETALINSMEGRRGNPRARPPYPTEAGLWGRPTVVNNVKTLANVSLILRFGADWFKEVGTERSPGTALVALSGQVERPGVYEVPMGMPIREVVGRIGGASEVKAVQTGGRWEGFFRGGCWICPWTSRG